MRPADVLTVAVTPARAAARARYAHYVVAHDGCTAYFAGDTYRGEFMSGIAQRLHPDVCLMPVTTFRIPMTMGNRGACEAARALGARVIVPIHLGIQPRSPLIRRAETVDSFRAMLRDAGVDARVVSLEPGESFEW